MTRWFEGNPLAVVLASISGGLLVISLALGVIWSLPPSAPATDSGTDESELTLDVPELGGSEPIETYAVITERPVFNESRQPALNDESADTGEDSLAPDEIDAPDFELAGIIITPSIRMVTLKDKDQSESLVAFEGQPLEGNYGSWQVSRIEPRQITLASDRGEEVQLKLEVHDATIATPPKPVAKNKDESAEAGGQASDDPSDQPLSRAEEIRQRIAQRREELRNAAENPDEAEAEPQDYRTAIKSMISESSRKNKTDENDQ